MTSAPEADRDELRMMVRGMLDDLSTSAAVRAVAESEARFDPSLWKQVSEVGWAGIEAPEQLGGGGASFADAAVVLTELGRHLATAPLASTMVLGLGALLLAGTPAQQAAWVPAVCEGRARGTAALDSDGSSATQEGDSWIVSGTWSYVPDADLADFVVLVARSGAEEVLLLARASDLDIRPTPMLDSTRHFCRLEAKGVRLDAEAHLSAGGSDAIAALRDRAALGTACDSLGLAERALAMTVDYAKTREQFGRQIGSFQAVKHECSNMLIGVETSRVAINTALAAYDASPTGASLEASMAKAHTNEAVAAVASSAVVLHGGIGVTWEHDAHLILKRAKLNQVLDGSTRYHRRRTADRVLGPVA
ncbi:MAG: acyl-CoA dehydrogenase family protein [Mycobacteriales bacterium]